ncbi:nitrilase-related carbon-nitrogen hydrolase, partial [Streptomyces sparsogenes]
MRIALSQIVSGPRPERNLAVLREQAHRAAAADARLIVFPEAAMACFGTPLAPLAEPLDGPWAGGVRQIAKDAGLVVVAGMFTPAPDGRVTNTLLATGPGVETS